MRISDTEKLLLSFVRNVLEQEKQTWSILRAVNKVTAS